MTDFPLRLDRYFFTEQQVIANPDYQANSGQQVDFRVDASASQIEGQPGRYGITAKVESNPEKSDNPPYSFAITAFGVIATTEGVECVLAEAQIETSAAQLLIGAIRERLAELTARGPWGTLYLDFVPIRIKIDHS